MRFSLAKVDESDYGNVSNVKICYSLNLGDRNISDWLVVAKRLMKKWVSSKLEAAMYLQYYFSHHSFKWSLT